MEDQPEPVYFHCRVFLWKSRTKKLSNQSFLNMRNLVYYIYFYYNAVQFHTDIYSPITTITLWVLTHKIGNKLFLLCLAFAHLSIVLTYETSAPLGSEAWRFLSLSTRILQTHLKNWHVLHVGKHTLHVTPLRVKSSCCRQIFVCTWAASPLRTSPSEVRGLAKRFQHKSSFFYFWLDLLLQLQNKVLGYKC